MGLKTAVIVADRILGMTVAEHGEDPKKPIPIGESETAMMSLGIGIGVAFVIMTAAALSSDFSVREIAVARSIMNDPLTAIFSGSTHSECHPLYHGLLWYWFHTFRGANEAFLRLPNVLFMLASAYVAFTSGKRLFRSPGMAWVLVGLILMSPTFVDNYAWAFGYAMAIFLAAVATAGALFVASGRRIHGLVLLTPALILLPWVIPATWTVGATLTLFLLLHFALQRRLKLNLLYVMLVMVIAGLGYSSMTLALATKTATTSVADGQGYGATMGVWLLAVLAQVGMFVTICTVARRQVDLPEIEKDKTLEEADAMLRTLPALAVVAAVVGAVALVGFGAAPMDCMPLLVLVSFGAIGWYDRRVNRVNKYFYIMMLVVFGNSLLVTRVARYLTDKDISRGRYVTNLLQRHDARSNAVSNAVQALLMARVPKASRFFVQPELFEKFKFYWMAVGGSSDQLEPLEEPLDLALEREHYPYFTVFAIGHNDLIMHDRLQRAFGRIGLQPMPGPPDIRILQVLPPPPQEELQGPPDLMPNTPIAWEVTP